MAQYRDIEARDFSAKFEEQKKDYVLVDVRTDEEYAEGRIPGTIHIPHDQLESRHEELAAYKDEPILLICRSGRRSVIAAEILSARGFTKLYNLKGGMLEWTGPVVAE